MELALNLVWLALVAASYWLWLRRPSFRGRGPRRGAEWLAGLVVLGCILFLVFPVISMSDDVRAAREFLEEPSPDQAIAKKAEIEKQVLPGTLPAPAVVAHLDLGSIDFHVLHVVSPAETPEHGIGPLRPSVGRAPPQA